MESVCKPRILVVDDEADILELIRFNLLNAGFAVDTATTGAEAIDRATLEAPSLIVLDLMLPELDGLSVCEILKSTPLTAAIPIVMLTGWSSEQARAIGRELGANDYIVKPFSPRELVARIQKILSRQTQAAPQTT